jgi:hypothetical protein
MPEWAALTLTMQSDHAVQLNSPDPVSQVCHRISRGLCNLPVQFNPVSCSFPVLYHRLVGTLRVSDLRGFLTFGLFLVFWVELVP